MPDPIPPPAGVVQPDATPAPQQGPVSPTTSPVVASDEDYQNALLHGLDNDKEMQDLLNKVTNTPTPEEIAKAADAPGLDLKGSLINTQRSYSALDQFGRQMALGLLKTGNAVLKTVDDVKETVGEGVLRGVGAIGHEGLKAAAAFNDNLVYATGAYRIGADEKQQQAFLKWYAQPARQRAHTMQFGDFSFDLSGTPGDAKWMGQASNGWAGLIESTTQFSLGLAVVEEMLPEVAEAGLPAAYETGAKALTKGAKILEVADATLANAAKSGATMMTFFSPYAKRFADAKGGLPGAVASLLPKYLQSNPNDPEAIGRLKNGLEGMLLGSTIDTFVALAKGTFHFYVGDAKGVAQAVKEAHAASTTPHPDDVLTVKPTPDGGAVVVANQAHPKVAEAAAPAEPTIIINGEKVPAPKPDAPSNAGSIPPNGTPVGPEAGTSVGRVPTSGLEDTAVKVEGKTQVANQASDTVPGQGKVPPKSKHQQKMEAPMPKDASAEGGVAFTAEDFNKMSFSEILDALGLTEGEGGGLKFKTPAEAEQAAATVNFQIKHTKTPPGQLAAEDVPAFQKAVQKYFETKDPRDAAEVLEQYGFNPNYLQTPEEVGNVLKAMVDAFPEPVASLGADFPKESFAQTTDKVVKMFDDIPMDKMLEWIHRHAQNMQEGPKWQASGRFLVESLSRRVNQLSKMVAANPDNALAMDQLAGALDTLMHLHADVAGGGSGAGRTLNIQKLPLDQIASAVGEVGEAVSHRAPPGRSITEGMTAEEIAGLARHVLYAEGDPSVIAKIVSGPLAPPPKIRASPTLMKQFKDFTEAWRMEAMLSLTVPKKIAADIVVGLTKPAEYWLAGFGESFGPNPERAQQMFQQGTDMYMAIWGNLRDSFKAGAKTFRVGQNILEGGYNLADSSKGLGALGENGWLQTIGRMPSRLVMTADEAAKNLNYRMYMRAKIVEQARAEGITSVAEIDSRVANDMKLAFDPQGGAVNAKGLDYAKLNTFTNELPKGSTVERLQGIQRNNWVARLAVPFWRTPVNIFNYTWERTPLLNMLNSQMRADIAAGGERAALARAKAQMGVAVFTAATMAAAGGLITGKGPSDPKMRQQMKEMGWAEYSVKVGNKWVSYKHADPYLMPLGIMADLYQMSGETDQVRHHDYVSMTMAALSGSFASRSYMEGMVQTMEALTDGSETKWYHLLSDLPTSFVPTIVSHNNPDQVIRETRGYIDEVQSKLPWFSEQLEPTYNIFGEPVLKAPGTFNRGDNPFTVTAGVKPGSLEDELIRLGHALPKPPNMIANNQVDMKDRETFPSEDGKSPYTHMMELIGKGPGNAPPLRQALEKLVNSDKYKSLPADSGAGAGGMRFQLVGSLVRTYQTAALAIVLRDDERLKTAYTEAMKATSLGKAGGQDVYNASLEEVTKKWGTELFQAPRKKAR